MDDLAAIKARMKKLGLTQAELADEIGVGAAQVSHLLTGRRRLRLDAFRRIDEALEKRERRAKASARGVSKSPQTDFAERIAAAFVTVEDIKAGRIKPVRLTKRQKDRMAKELKALGEALRRAPVVSTLSDDELLGYDEML